MKKNIFKKIVATLATAAMAVGMFAAMPATDAKAAAGSKETKLVLVVSGSTAFDKIYLDINDGANSQNAGITSPSTPDSTNLGWGREMYVCEKDANKSNVYTVVTKGTLNDGEYCNMQFNFAKDGSLVAGCKYYPQNDMAQFNDNGVLYISINVDDVVSNMWCEVKASTTDPTKVDASGVIAAINAIGTVELTEESLAKITAAESTYDNFINAGGDKADVTNYATLTAARAKYEQLQAAEDAKAAGKLTIFVKTPENWDEVAVYGWYKDGAKAFGEWPGTKLTALEKNTGWYSCSFDIKKAANIIFNNNNKGEQTVDWNGVVAGTYYMELSEKADDGKFKVDNVSTKAPAGWKDENAQDVDTQPDSTPDKTPDKTPNPETGDASAVVLMLAVAAVAAGAVVVSRKRAVNE